MLQLVRGAIVLAFAIGVFSINAGSASAEPGRRVSTRDLATLRDLDSLSVSPNGAWAAFQVTQADPDRNTYDIAWHVVATDNQKAVHRVADAGGVAPFGEGSIRFEFYSYEPPPPPVWSPDSVWITFLRWDGDRAQIWRSRRGGAAEQLTRGQAHVRRFVYAPDGARILYETEPSMAQTRDALAAEGRAGLLFDDKFYPAYDIRALQPDSISSTSSIDLVAGTEKIQSASRAIWTIDLSQRRERPATASEQSEFETLLAPLAPKQAMRMTGEALASPGGALAWTEARDPQRQGFRPPVTLVAQPREGGAPIVCSAPACKNQVINGVWWRNDDELVFLRAEGRGRDGGMDAGLYSWKINDGAVRTVLQTQGRLLGHVSSTGIAQSSCEIASGRLLCFYEDLTTPRRLVAIDLNTGALKTLYDPNPKFAHFDLGAPPQRLEFRGKSGETYPGVLALPTHRGAGKRLPLVIVTYRCSGFLRGGIGDEYPVYPLVAEGFAVLCLEAPDGRERQATLDYTAYNRWFWRGAGEKMFLDSLEAAIRYLDEAQIIDPDRVGITGLSHGAQLVGWAMTGAPRLAAAIASGAPGNSGPSSYYLMTDQFRQMAPELYGVGNPLDTPQQWRDYSFSGQVDRVRAPLLINAADHELMLALEPVIELRDAGRAVEMYVYPDEFHWKWQPAHRLAIFNRNIDWMNFWLRDVADPDPGKDAQYRRWRGMRERSHGAGLYPDPLQAK